MAQRVVTVFGGSGFIGRHLVGRLAKQGWIVRVAVRRPSRAGFLKPRGEVGQITPLRAPVWGPIAVEAAMPRAARRALGQLRAQFFVGPLEARRSLDRFIPKPGIPWQDRACSGG